MTCSVNEAKLLAAGLGGVRRGQGGGARGGRGEVFSRQGEAGGGQGATACPGQRQGPGRRRLEQRAAPSDTRRRPAATGRNQLSMTSQTIALPAISVQFQSAIRELAREIGWKNVAKRLAFGPTFTEYRDSPPPHKNGRGNRRGVA